MLQFITGAGTPSLLMDRT